MREIRVTPGRKRICWINWLAMWFSSISSERVGFLVNIEKKTCMLHNIASERRTGWHGRRSRWYGGKRICVMWNSRSMLGIKLSATQCWRTHWVNCNIRVAAESYLWITFFLGGGVWSLNRVLVLVMIMMIWWTSERPLGSFRTFFCDSM